MKSLRERTEIQQAYLGGQTIEEWIDGEWLNPPGEPRFNWNRYDYRVKLKPLVVWCNTYPERVYCHTSERIAQNAVHQDAIRAGVKCVEVINE